MIDYPNLMTKAERLRKQLGEDNSSPVDIFSMAQRIEKLTIAYYPMGSTLSGMCVKGGCALILHNIERQLE